MQVVRFLGAPGIRAITPADWAGAGFPDHKEVRWDRFNNWTVPVEALDLDEIGMAQVIYPDNQFRVEEVE